MYLRIILIGILFWGCHSKAIDKTKSVQKDSSFSVKIENKEIIDKIVDSIANLPFVKKNHNYIDSITNHKHGIAFLIDTIKETNEILLKAGFNGEERFETIYQFYVNPKTLSIKIYNPVKEETLSLEDYFKNRTQ